MKTNTLAMAFAVTALSSLAPGAAHAQTATNPASTVPIILTRATNQLIDASNDVRTVTVWSDYSLQPGEAFSIFAQRGAAPPQQQPTSLFIHWRPESTRTSSAFSWFFGGNLAPGFGEAEADAALAQIKDRFTDHATTLIPNEPQQLFSVKNQEGVVMNGSIEFIRQTPVSGETAEAVIRLRDIRAVNPMAPSVGFSATLPRGYALRASANTGFATIMSPAGPYQYRGVWNDLPMPHPIRVTPGQRPQLLTPPKPLSAAEIEIQRNVLQSQLEQIQDQGSMHLVLGTPKQIFSLTNGSGEVFQGFLELVGPGTQTTQADLAMPAETSQTANEHIVHLANQQQRQIEHALPAAAAPSVQPQVAIDPATGLPRTSAAAAH